MVQDAEANAEKDAQRRQMIEMKNELDSLIYTTEKSLTDNAEKLGEETKTEVQKAIDEAKKVKDSEDFDTVKEKKEALSQASSKIGQEIYGKPGGDGAAAGGEEKKDDATDAEFTEKEKDKENMDEKKDDEKKDK